MNATNDHANFLVFSAQGEHWTGHSGTAVFDLFLVFGHHGCSQLRFGCFCFVFDLQHTPLQRRS